MLGHLVFHPVPFDVVVFGWSVLCRAGQAALEASPYLLMGLLTAGVLQGAVGSADTRRLFGDGRWSGPLRAWLAGVLLPVCSLGALPVARQLLRSRVPEGTVLAFLLSAPVCNPITIAYGLSTRQSEYVVLFVLASLGLSVGIGGWWNGLRPAEERGDPEPETLPPESALARLWAAAVASARQATGPAMPFVLLGLAGAGLTAAVLPYGFLEFTMQQKNPFAPMQMMLVAPTGYVPPDKAMMAATTLLSAGGSMAAAFVLLLVGAGTNLGTLVWTARAFQSVESDELAGHTLPRDAPAAIARSVLSGACVILGLAMGSSLMAIAPFMSGIIIAAWEPARAALSALRRGEFSFEAIHVLAAFSACAIGAWAEGAILLFLTTLSLAVQAYLAGRSRRAIEALAQLRPESAHRVGDDGAETRVPLVGLAVGDTVRVRPGDHFPVDGEVTDGETWADESALTGESRPVCKSLGAAVLAGTINGSGSVLVRMTVPLEESALERIIRLVRSALEEKTDTDRLIETWQKPYAVAAVIAAAAAFLVYWLLLGRAPGSAGYQAAVMLVVASPCAAVLAAPSAFLAALTLAARRGVLCKGPAHLERLGRAATVAFDKTGTLTTGRPTVTEVWAAPGATPEAVLAVAAGLEHHSRHPLARAVLECAAARGVTAIDVADFRWLAGRGVTGRAGDTGRGVDPSRAGDTERAVDTRRGGDTSRSSGSVAGDTTGGSRWVAAGNEALFTEAGHALPAEVAERLRALRAGGSTALAVMDSAGAAGVIAIADELRPEARSVVSRLRQLGVARVVLLTGDHRAVAEPVVRALDLDDGRAELLPAGKVAELTRLREEAAGGARGAVVMVGDGINDGPALAAADIGVAMGGRGSDVALEAADIVLMRDDLQALPTGIEIARAASERAAWNLRIALWSIGGLLVATFAGMPLWMGVIGHEGSTILVALNGVRLLWSRLGRQEGSS